MFRKVIFTYFAPSNTRLHVTTVKILHWCRLREEVALVAGFDPLQKYAYPDARDLFPLLRTAARGLLVVQACFLETRSQQKTASSVKQLSPV